MLMLYLNFMRIIETKSKWDIKVLKLSYKKNIDVTQLRSCPNRLYLYMYYGPKHGWFGRVYILTSNDCRTILSNIKNYLHMTKFFWRSTFTHDKVNSKKLFEHLIYFAYCKSLDVDVIYLPLHLTYLA